MSTALRTYEHSLTDVLVCSFRQWVLWSAVWHGAKSSTGSDADTRWCSCICSLRSSVPSVRSRPTTGGSSRTAWHSASWWPASHRCTHALRPAKYSNCRAERWAMRYWVIFRGRQAFKTVLDVFYFVVSCGKTLDAILPFKKRLFEPLWMT